MMQGVRFTIANMVADRTALLQWLTRATPGDFVTYHIGNLPIDRTQNPELDEIAEIVRVLQESGFLMGSSRPIILADIQGRAYFAQRTGAGNAPLCILNGTMQARYYRAICALRDKGAYQSSHRIIRDALSCSEDHAADVLAYIYAHGWIEPAEQKGYRLSADGAMAIL